MSAEPYLGTIRATTDVLRRYGLRARRKFGQNFLVEEHVLRDIVETAGIDGNTCVLEIGPGIGTLTQYLAYAAGRVCAVEIDRELIPVLQETLAGWDNVEIVQGDILQIDIAELLGTDLPSCKVVANLPYYITTPILMELLERDLPFAGITVMVQREVAERMVSAPGTKDYGALSLAVQYRCKAEIAFPVPPACFYPRPEVTSAVVQLERRKGRMAVRDEAKLFAVIKAAFGQRRKTLVNALGNAAEPACTKEEVRAALAACSLPETVRGEALSLEEFVAIAEKL